MQKTIPSWNQAFVNATKVHWDHLLRFAMSLTSSRPEAEDVVQNSLIKALQAFQRFVEENFSISDPSQVSALFQEEKSARYLKNWLFKIVKNTWLDQASNSRRWCYDETGRMFETLPEANKNNTRAEPSQVVAEANLPSNATLEAEEKAFFETVLDDNWQAAFNQLNPRQKTAIFLSAHDYSYREIADVLDIPLGTVMSTLSRAIRKLRTCLNME